MCRGRFTRRRVIPAKHWARACEVGIGITKACMATPAHADCAAPESGLSAVGEVRLVPDPATLVALTYAPGHCLVLGSLFNGQVLRSSKSKGACVRAPGRQGVCSTAMHGMRRAGTALPPWVVAPCPAVCVFASQALSDGYAGSMRGSPTLGAAMSG